MPEQARGFVRLRFIMPRKTPLGFRPGRDVAVLLLCTVQKKHTVLIKIASCEVLPSAHDSLLEDSGKPTVTRTSPPRAADYCLLLLNLHSVSYNPTTRSPTVNLVKKPSDLMTYE